MAKPKTETQLYTLFRRLRSGVPDGDEGANVVGYVILNALLRGIEESPSRDQRPDELQVTEVKNIYVGLEAAVSAVGYRGSPTTAFDYLCELKSGVDPRLRELFESKEPEIKARSLLRPWLDRLSRQPKSYEDRIRRDSLALVEAVLERGQISGGRASIEDDWRLMDQYLRPNR